MYFKRGKTTLSFYGVPITMVLEVFKTLPENIFAFYAMWFLGTTKALLKMIIFSKKSTLRGFGNYPI